MRGDAATAAAAAEVVIDSYVSEKEREEGNAAATKTFSQLTFRGRQKQHRKRNTVNRKITRPKLRELPRESRNLQLIFVGILNRSREPEEEPNTRGAH